MSRNEIPLSVLSNRPLRSFPDIQEQQLRLADLRRKGIADEQTIAANAQKAQDAAMIRKIFTAGLSPQDTLTALQRGGIADAAMEYGKYLTDQQRGLLDMDEATRKRASDERKARLRTITALRAASPEARPAFAAQAGYGGGLDDDTLAFMMKMD